MFETYPGYSQSISTPGSRVSDWPLAKVKQSSVNSGFSNSSRASLTVGTSGLDHGSHVPGEYLPARTCGGGLLEPTSVAPAANGNLDDGALVELGTSLGDRSKKRPLGGRGIGIEYPRTHEGESHMGDLVEELLVRCDRVLAESEAYQHQFVGGLQLQQSQERQGENHPVKYMMHLLSVEGVAKLRMAR